MPPVRIICQRLAPGEHVGMCSVKRLYRKLSCIAHIRRTLAGQVCPAGEEEEKKKKGKKMIMLEQPAHGLISLFQTASLSLSPC